MEKIFRPTVRMIILKEDKILLCKMGKIWGLPGGGVDWGEQLDHALVRESIEELGIKAIFDTILFVQDYIGTKKGGENMHFLEYFCTIKNQQDFFNVTDTYESSTHAFELLDLQWFGVDEIPKTMMPQGFIPILQKYIQNNTGGAEYISGILDS